MLLYVNERILFLTMILKWDNHTRKKFSRDMGEENLSAISLQHYNILFNKQTFNDNDCFQFCENLWVCIIMNFVAPGYVAYIKTIHPVIMTQSVFI